MESVKRYRQLRRLEPDAALLRRRAAGETLRLLARDYGVSHTSLSRYFARPGVVKQLKQAERFVRAEQRAVDARWRSEQATRDADRVAQRQAAEAWSAAGRSAAEPLPGGGPEGPNGLEPVRVSAQPVPALLARPERQRRGSRQAPLFQSESERYAYYEARAHLSENDMLNWHDVRAGRLTPAEKRALRTGR